MNNNFQNLSGEAINSLKMKGVDPKNLNSKTAQDLMNNLKVEDKEKINALLKNKQALNEFLNSEKAKAIMSQLFKNNGPK